LTQHGKPLHPYHRIRREWVDYQQQSPSRHMEFLKMYVQIAPDLVPKHDDNMTRPSIRHPDIQPNNVFVSQNLEITGLIDWQHCAILPLFLQAGVPGSLQNYGDAVSESLETRRTRRGGATQACLSLSEAPAPLKLCQGDHAPVSLPRQGARRLPLRNAP
jgi:hypothetical protein